MTHDQLVIKAAKWLKRHPSNGIVPNCPTIAEELQTVTPNGEIPDVLGFSNRCSVLIEVKVTRSDFIKDKKKLFRTFPWRGMGQMRFYCCPEGLISENEIPDNWGLLYSNGKERIKLIKNAVIQAANDVAERTVLLSIIRRLNKRK
jgi:hypothetical protein